MWEAEFTLHCLSEGSVSLTTYIIVVNTTGNFFKAESFSNNLNHSTFETKSNITKCCENHILCMMESNHMARIGDQSMPGYHEIRER